MPTPVCVCYEGEKRVVQIVGPLSWGAVLCAAQKKLRLPRKHTYEPVGTSRESLVTLPRGSTVVIARAGQHPVDSKGKAPRTLLQTNMQKTEAVNTTPLAPGALRRSRPCWHLHWQRRPEKGQRSPPFPWARCQRCATTVHRTTHSSFYYAKAATAYRIPEDQRRFIHGHRRKWRSGKKAGKNRAIRIRARRHTYAFPREACLVPDMETVLASRRCATKYFDSVALPVPRLRHLQSEVEACVPNRRHRYATATTGPTH
eukprot:TRINITY_DN10717_c0_g1_i1.p1 TRINITY_DN10717_c0_g1~~TRINITY_DN10717_c0_g1_i1.p1  ORF type:complete len:258 (-),score=13.43 TRINITY_DN10717_c0_g1_i1:70-843(-)